MALQETRDSFNLRIKQYLKSQVRKKNVYCYQRKEYALEREIKEAFGIVSINQAKSRRWFCLQNTLYLYISVQDKISLLNGI